MTNKDDDAQRLTPPPVAVGRIVVCRLGGGEKATLSRILRQSSDTWRETGGPILLWAIIDPLAELPLQEAQEVVQRTTASLLNYCELITLILRGSDIRQTLLRTALRSLTINAAGATPRVRIVESFAPVMRAARNAGFVTAELEQAIRAVGFTDKADSIKPARGSRFTGTM